MSSIFRLALAMLWACRSFSTAACISALTGVAFSRLRFVLRGLCPSAITLTRTDPGNIFPLTFTLSSPLKADYIQKCYLLSSAQRSVSTGHLRVVSGLLHRPPFGVTFPQFRVVFKERPYNFPSFTSNTVQKRCSLTPYHSCGFSGFSIFKQFISPSSFHLLIFIIRDSQAPASVFAKILKIKNTGYPRSGGITNTG